MLTALPLPKPSRLLNIIETAGLGLATGFEGSGLNYARVLPEITWANRLRKPELNKDQIMMGLIASLEKVGGVGPSQKL